MKADSRFVFDTKINVQLGATAIQLSEVVLRGLDGVALPIMRASNPNGTTPVSQQPSNLFDDDLNSKWLDSNVGGGTSTLVIELFVPTAVLSYELVTANDQPSRDPREWTFEQERADAFGTYEVCTRRIWGLVGSSSPQEGREHLHACDAPCSLRRSLHAALGMGGE